MRLSSVLAFIILYTSLGHAQLKEDAIVMQEFIYEEAPFPSCHASTIVETQPGRFLCAWFGGTDEGEDDVGIWLSAFDGESWSAPREVASDPRRPCWNPVLLRTRAGETLLFYKAGPSPREWSGLVIRSTDDGATWSEPEWLPGGILGPIKNRPLELESGDIVCGSSVESWQLWGCWAEITSDGGRTWAKHGPINVPGEPYGIIQPGMFALPDGDVGMLCRSTGRIGKVVRAISNDGGRTWSDAEPTDLPNPNSGIDAETLTDGRVALVYNHTTAGRHPIHIALSDDYGVTWPEPAILEDGDMEFSYPAVIQSLDGLLHITYTWNRTRIRHVVLDPAEL